jgi:hypothetical protein
MFQKPVLKLCVIIAVKIKFGTFVEVNGICSVSPLSPCHGMACTWLPERGDSFQVLIAVEYIEQAMVN